MGAHVLTATHAMTAQAMYQDQNAQDKAEGSMQGGGDAVCPLTP
jgi:hypothetical protein